MNDPEDGVPPPPPESSVNTTSGRDTLESRAPASVCTVSVACITSVSVVPLLS